MIEDKNKPAEYALIAIFVMIGFFIGILVGGSGGYILAPKPDNAGSIGQKIVTKFQCANGSLFDDIKKCPALGIPSQYVNQTKYVFRNETQFLPCNCLRDCGVDRPVITTTTLPQKPKVYCRSDRDCGILTRSAIKCSISQESYQQVILPRCEMNATQPFCYEEQTKEVLKQCGADNDNERCRPGVGCVIESS